MAELYERDKVAQEIADECWRAMHLWPKFPSAHHGLSVIEEELAELRQHVYTNQKRRDIPAMREEAIQVAAMALRFVVEVCNEETGRI